MTCSSALRVGNGTRGKERGRTRRGKECFLVRLMHTDTAYYVRPAIIYNKGVTDTRNWVNIFRASNLVRNVSAYSFQRGPHPDDE